MKLNTIKTGIALSLLAAGLAGPFCSAALAQGTAQERSACEGDAFRFCLGDIPDVPKIEACLRAHERELTPACRDEFLPEGKTKLKPEHFK